MFKLIGTKIIATFDNDKFSFLDLWKERITDADLGLCTTVKHDSFAGESKYISPYQRRSLTGNFFVCSCFSYMTNLVPVRI